MVAFPQKLSEEVKHFIQGKVIAFDTETTGLRYWHGEAPYGFGFCNEDGETVYIDFPVDPWTRIPIPQETQLHQIKLLLEDPTITKVMHNAKFDTRMMETNYGIKVAGVIEETMFMAHVCNTLEPSYKLKQLSEKYLDYSKSDQDMLKKATVKARRQAKKLGWPKADSVHADYWMVKALNPQSRLCEIYCGGDVERTMLLRFFYQDLMDELDVRDAYEHEMELWHINYRMETRGVRITSSIVEEEIESATKERDTWHDFVADAAWPGFQIDSDPDARKLFYEKLGLPVLVFTDKEKLPSVAAGALMQHVDNPVVSALFKYRAAAKALSNFFIKYKYGKCPDPLSPGNYALHPDFNQVGPCTGRYSCRQPNLQNVANALTTRSSEPIQARRPFGPRKGYWWYHIDYANLEVRIFADVAQELFMLDAFLNERDLHTECANKAWGGEGNDYGTGAALHALELDGTGSHDNLLLLDVWKELGINPTKKRLSHSDQMKIARLWMETHGYNIVKAEGSLKKKTSRAKAKMVLFLKVFGGGPPALADLMRCTISEATTFLHTYDEAFPRINEYSKELIWEAKQNGFIRNTYNRRLSVDHNFLYRCVNYKVQGSAADLMKRSMMKCDKFLLSTGLDAHIVMTIHDEIVFEIKKEHAYLWLLTKLCRIMAEHDGHFGIATPVEIDRVDVRWNEKKPVNGLKGYIYA